MIQFSIVQHTSLGVCGWRPHTRQTVVATEPSWHRNERKRRHRARLIVKAAAAGKQVSGSKLAAAKTLLLNHHATRGAASEAMGHGKNGKGNTAIKVPWANDWKCSDCSRPGAPHFCFAKDGKCRGCHGAKPDKPYLYSFTYEYKQNGDGKGSGNKGGYESASAKQIRELQEERDEAANQREIKRLEAEKKEEQWDKALQRKEPEMMMKSLTWTRLMTSWKRKKMNSSSTLDRLKK